MIPILARTKHHLANSDQTFTIFGVENFFHQGGTIELEQKKDTGLYQFMKKPTQINRPNNSILLLNSNALHYFHSYHLQNN